MKARSPAGLFLLCILLLFTITACDGLSIATTGTAVGSKAPDFVLQDLAGYEVQLSRLEGKIVVLVFWATWCRPCRSELPVLQSLHERRGDDVAVLAISTGENRNTVSSFITRNRYTFRVLTDPDMAVAGTYQARRVPTLVIIDREGVIRKRHQGVMSAGDLDLALISLFLK